MRKRNIKTIAHWVIMSILLLFPILMVGISSFANEEQSVTVTETYEYETNEINSVNDIVIGNVYNITLEDQDTLTDYFSSDENYLIGYVVNGDLRIEEYSCEINEIVKPTIFNKKYKIGLSYYYLDFYLSDNQSDYLSIELSIDVLNACSFDFLITDFNLSNNDFYNLTHITASDYLGQVTTNVDIQNASYKQEINNWCNGFKNLPVNQWYGQLLNVIGVGQTTNSVMNVIYVYPLYVLWVYLIDLIVDCLLLIVHFGHNALSRLGGDND